MRRALAAMAGLAALLAAGCGSRVDPTVTPFDQVTFTGGRIQGTLYIAAGQDELNQDLYRVRGRFATARRLTMAGRISWLTAGDGRLVSANARGSGSDHIESLRIGDDGPALPGRILDRYGQTPALSPSGRLAFTSPLYSRGGAQAGAELIVADANGRRKRVLYRTRRDLSSPAWLPGGRLAVLEETPGGSRLVIDPGRADARSIGLGMKQLFGLAADRQGRMFAIGELPRRFALISAGGSVRRVTSPWHPDCWSPDGRGMLAHRARRLALLDPSTLSARPIARVKGVVGTCAWIA